MKTTFNTRKTLVTFILGFSIACGARAADAITSPANAETNSAATTRPATNSGAMVVAPVNLGFYVEDGISNRIIRVLSATPTYVQILFTNEQAIVARKIPRHELPPELAIKYPYDAEKAAAYKAGQAANAAQQQFAQQAAQQNAALQQTALLNAKIAQLVFQDKELQKEVNLYTRMPWGNGRKVHLAHLLDQQQFIREQVIQLRRQLVARR